MKRDGGLVEAMGGCRPPTPAPAGWVRPWIDQTHGAVSVERRARVGELPPERRLRTCRCGT